MRKLITFCLTCIVLSTMLTSCGSLSLIKRHYEKGYYIDRTPAGQARIAPKQEKRIVIAGTSQPVYTTEAAVKQNTNNLHTSKSAVATPTVNAKKLHKAVTPQQTTGLLVKGTPVVIENTTTQDIQESSQAEKMTNDSGDSRGLSLLWLVIVIVLVIWLIGIAAGGFGLGGLINLLLIIAIILLILWLLRII